jgi:hypothetical protein
VSPCPGADADFDGVLVGCGIVVVNGVGGGGGGGGGVVVGGEVVVVGTVGVGSVVAGVVRGPDPGVCFPWVVLESGCVASDTNGVGTAVARLDEMCGEAARRGGFGIAGAWTTRLPGPGASAMPTGVVGDASKRGINAPPATAIASRSPATTRSLRLM